MSSVNSDDKKPRGHYAPLIAACIHTGLVAAMLSFITYRWMYTNDEYVQFDWCVFLLLDSPLGLLALLAIFGMEWANLSFSPYVDYVMIPALLFSVLGGTQWYFIVRYFTKRKVISGPTCPKCGYLLVGTTSDRCPECGEQIQMWMMNWIEAASLLSGCKDDDESPSDESSE